MRGRVGSADSADRFVLVPKREGDHHVCSRLDRLRAEQVCPGPWSGEVVNIVFQWAPVQYSKVRFYSIQKIPQ